MDASEIYNNKDLTFLPARLKSFLVIIPYVYADKLARLGLYWDTLRHTTGTR